MTSKNDEDSTTERKKTDISVNVGKLKELQDSFLSGKPSQKALEISRKQTLKAQREATIFVMTHDNPSGEVIDLPDDLSKLVPETSGKTVQAKPPGIKSFEVKPPTISQETSHKQDDILESVSDVPDVSVTQEKESIAKQQEQDSSTKSSVLSEQEKSGYWGEEPTSETTSTKDQPVEPTVPEPTIKDKEPTTSDEPQPKPSADKPKSSLFNRARSIFSSITKKTDKDK